MASSGSATAATSLGAADPSCQLGAQRLKRRERLGAHAGLGERRLLQLNRLLPDQGALAPAPGQVEGKLAVCTYNGNTWNTASSVHEWMRKKGMAPHAMFVQEARFTSNTAVEQAH
eukprot:2623690-Pyramimonas_sp.AAC.1